MEYELLKKAVAEVFDEKIAELKLHLIPTVSDEEQKEIEEIFGEKNDMEDEVFYEVDL